MKNEIKNEELVNNSNQLHNTETLQIMEENLLKMKKGIKIDDCVLDRRREWFQPKYQDFDFDNDYKNWYVVETWFIDNTEKIKMINNPLCDGTMYEFVKYSPDNFFNYKLDGGVNEVREGVDVVWNGLPFEEYESPYTVLVSNCFPLELVSKEKWVLTLLNDSKKIINHSTINSLELMTKEVSEWKMKSMWEGHEPLFYRD